MKSGRIITAVLLLLATAAGLLFPTVLKKREDGDLGKLLAADSLEAVSLDYQREVSLVEKLAVAADQSILTSTELNKGIFLTEEEARKSALFFLEKLTGNKLERLNTVEISPWVLYYEDFGSLVAWTVHMAGESLTADFLLDDATGGILSCRVDLADGNWNALWEVVVTSQLANGDVRSAIRDGIINALRDSWRDRIKPQMVYVRPEGTIYGGGRHSDDSGQFFGEIFWGELEITVSDESGHECVLPVEVLDNWSIMINQ